MSRKDRRARQRTLTLNHSAGVVEARQEYMSTTLGDQYCSPYSNRWLPATRASENDSAIEQWHCLAAGSYTKYTDYVKGLDFHQG